MRLQDRRISGTLLIIRERLNDILLSRTCSDFTNKIYKYCMVALLEEKTHIQTLCVLVLYPNKIAGLVPNFVRLGRSLCIVS